MIIIGIVVVSGCVVGQERQVEKLDRGLIVVRENQQKAFLSWRLLKSDPDNISFDVYRETEGTLLQKLTSTPISDATCFTDSLADLKKKNVWLVKATSDGKDASTSTTSLAANAPLQSFLSVPLKTPQGYRPNDISPGDLDGDGNYELVVHMTGKAHDNSHKGITDPPILHAYKMDGTLLWEINLGINIREGAHYTQFMVFDLDGDGRAEVACKTADGSRDGKSKVIGDMKADHRNVDGYILKGAEYLSIFDGLTGEVLTTTEYLPARHPETSSPTFEQMKSIWGDGYGNRMDRFLACIAYLDGKRPSLVMARGYYTRTVLSAWNWRDGKLSHQWTFDSDASEENKKYGGQGNHNLSVADVDGDGRDEIIYGACVIDDDGKGLHTTGLGHGDALHVSDLDPDRPGLEIFDIQERFDDAGMHFRDAMNGNVLWRKPSIKAGEDGEGPGRGNAFDIDPRYPGFECWVKGANITGLYSCKGTLIASQAPTMCNFAVWWDGDLLRELLDKNVIAKWNWERNALASLMTASECDSNNGTKATPALCADLFGDWREEVIWRTKDNTALHIYTTTIPTRYRFVTLMHDPVYRLAIAWQNVAYNQPPHVSYYLGVK
ncbi:hypothetical protein DQQ10_12225 [Pseudochryseolinea flava]|uniref:Rhamnogalacturonan I lyase beta-sheet domain-containing protein n=2 Tax=Pseudochryseolinea flava TaxID=2059302 RepID=A0A364Y5P0_9BACT|nr:hypothetical protein DQQ10_12225 [Pseudochryseolinea flava]